MEGPPLAPVDGFRASLPEAPLNPDDGGFFSEESRACPGAEKEGRDSDRRRTGAHGRARNRHHVNRHRRSAYPEGRARCWVDCYHW